MLSVPRSSAEIEELRAAVTLRAAQLKPHEIWWRDKQQLLEEHGYMLRPRFRPGWTPSWLSNGGVPDLQEDYWDLPLTEDLIDATRLLDGKPVYVKRVETGEKDIEIATYFSQARPCDDPRNHCVPILESFEDDQDNRISYIVMPLLRFMNDPPFGFVRDIVACVDQLLEGLVFLHEHHVTHRDCSPGNLMMDALSGMFPRDHHPQTTHSLPDMSARAPFLPRIAARPPIQYYYIDFGISSRFSPDENSKLVYGQLGRDREVPELLDSVPYDPFKVDVFLIGNVFRRMMHDQYTNVKFLQPLIESMTQENPVHRPDAAQAREAWQKIRQGIWLVPRARRFHKCDESRVESMLLDARGLFELGSVLTRRLFRRTGKAR